MGSASSTGFSQSGRRSAGFSGERGYARRGSGQSAAARREGHRASLDHARPVGERRRGSGGAEDEAPRRALPLPDPAGDLVRRPPPPPAPGPAPPLPPAAGPMAPWAGERSVATIARPGKRRAHHQDLLPGPHPARPAGRSALARRRTALGPGRARTGDSSSGCTARRRGPRLLDKSPLLHGSPRAAVGGTNLCSLTTFQRIGEAHLQIQGQRPLIRAFSTRASRFAA